MCGIVCAFDLKETAKIKFKKHKNSNINEQANKKK